MPVIGFEWNQQDDIVNHLSLIENKCLILSNGEYQKWDSVNGWTTVSSTLPNSTQFLSEGMNSLSPLLDRRVETLEPLPMTNTNVTVAAGKTGKVFSKTIDLKKYLDIRSLKVEVN